MHILIVGIGYVGLVTAACFAEMGHRVTCLDIDTKKINGLKEAQIPIYEPGLEEMVRRNLAQKRLFFTADYAEAIDRSSICFLALPTPSREDGSCDTRFVQQAVRQLAQLMQSPKIFVTKSTVPPGTGQMIQEWIQEELNQRGSSLTFEIASNPEFLKEGAALQDCLKPDRIIIGSNSEKAVHVLRELYTPFNHSRDRIFVMDLLSAEMTKYAANAMLATRISFMNEIAQICKQIGANVNEVRKGIGSDPRIGYNFLYPGVGYGGSCFPKDLRALIALSKQVGLDPALLQSVDTVNHRQKKVLSETIDSYFAQDGGVQTKTIAVWGIAFKPDTDDIREAPSLTFIEELLQKGATLRLFDPVAMDNAKRELKTHPRLIWCDSEEEAALGSDGIALLTEWKQFRLLDFHPILEKMRGKAFFDGRNQYHPSEMKKRGFDYMAIGVPDCLQKN